MTERYTGKQLRQAMVRAAHTLFRMNIRDNMGPKPNPDITMLFDENDWGGWLRNPERGGCPDGYTRPPDPDYCGHTVAWAARHVGDHLEDDQSVGVMIDPAIAKGVLPSTYRLSRDEKWEDAGHEPPDYVAPERIGPGDIVVVGDSKPYGSHITLCIYPLKDGEFATVEGNATVTFPDGTRGKGVGKDRHSLDEVAAVYRLDSSHCIEV